MRLRTLPGLVRETIISLNGGESSFYFHHIMYRGERRYRSTGRFLWYLIHCSLIDRRRKEFFYVTGSSYVLSTREVNWLLDLSALVESSLRVKRKGILFRQVYKAGWSWS